MKLLYLTFSIVLIINSVASQKFPQEQYSFPPQFQTPSSGVFPSDNLLYLPPESHTTLPYFPLKDYNKLPYQYLPPTGTKAPAVYPTPFPLMFSTTLVPSFDDDEEDDDKHKVRISTPRPQPSPPPNKLNNTEKLQQQRPSEKKEMRSMTRMPNYPHPIDRNDMKFPPQFSPNFRIQTPPSNQAPSAQRMIISSETHRNDHMIDQVKTASFQGNQYFPQPGSYFQSTTEPAIPIIRLSNEMDLDGSFSYEALGADQTHYVQHSRMENMGSEKEEQVVEGSYSYVGDNGQTYTVHYVADSNGFRASGDHLPVPPPMPEIIQRSVQYNLAEEAKRPPHLKSWSNEENYSEDKGQHYSASPPRNLFTGRNPEAFSYGFSQGQNQNNNNNNLIPAASSQVPVKTSAPLDFSADQNKPKGANGAPISPQITFLASQGAHVPAINAPQPPISRLFSTEKSTLPQLMNYEAGVKDLDEENSKALWRWQYGLNAGNANENQNKNTISRSSSENDDIMINFGDMTSDQYSKMMRSQLEPNLESYGGQGYDSNNNNNYQSNFYSSNYQNVHSNMQPNHNLNVEDKKEKTKTDVKQIPVSESKIAFPYPEDWYSKTQKFYNTKEKQHQTKEQHQQQEQKQQYDLYLQQQNQRIEQEKRIQYQQQQKQDQEKQKIQQEEERLLKLEEQRILKQEEERLLKEQELQLKQEEDQLKKQQEEIKGREELHKQILRDEQLKESKSAEYHKNIITHHNFKLPQSQTVTQSYDYEDSSYEPRRIKSFTAISTPRIETTHRIEYVTTPKAIQEDYFNLATSSYESSPILFEQLENKFKAEMQTTTTTQEPQFLSTEREIKFTDFIVPDDENDKFKPMLKSKTYIINQDSEKELTTTTTESSTEDILLNNIFLRNFVKPVIKENYDTNRQIHAQAHQNENKKTENVKHTEPNAYVEPSTEKIPKFVQYQPKSQNDMKVLKKKPLDMSDLLNYVSFKNQFESSKTKTKSAGSKSLNDFGHKNDMHFVPIEDHRHKETRDNYNKNENNQRNHHNREQKGVLKNYKILQRNNNMNSDGKDQQRRELSPPPLTMLQAPSLPPLGRAGPSMKSYLPPIYV